MASSGTRRVNDHKLHGDVETEGTKVLCCAHPAFLSPLFGGLRASRKFLGGNCYRIKRGKAIAPSTLGGNLFLVFRLLKSEHWN